MHGKEREKKKKARMNETIQSISLASYDSFSRVLTWTLVIVFRIISDTCFAKRVPTRRQCTRIPKDLVTERAYEILSQSTHRLAHGDRSGYRIVEDGSSEQRRLCRAVITTGRVWAFRHVESKLG
jgi:hypothetical protein